MFYYNYKLIGKIRRQGFFIITYLLIMGELSAQEHKLIVPLGGNSWVTVKSKSGSEAVTNEGWANWQSSETVFSVFIKLAKIGTLSLSAKMSVPGGKSNIQCLINKEKNVFTVEGIEKKEFNIGEWNIAAPGYIQIDFKGISKTGKLFAQIESLQISGSAVDENVSYVKNNEGNFFYWGRRGPSVHLNYESPANDVEWFYNEVTVPKGNDVIGSYFMADGFAEGYFGMQVNSATERRILFSVWSPYSTDNPKEIPEDKRIILVKKGKDVHAGEFGDEGSGGQSYMLYNWKAGSTYKFLLHARPDEKNNTVFTAYFYSAERQQWMLVASFRRPATHTYLTRLHSFLENFIPETGYITRKAWYHNQWIRSKDGEWKAITKARLTSDKTAMLKYRVDYAGGEKDGQFYLQNCGFFNSSSILQSEFSNAHILKPPVINFSSLK